MIQTHGVEVHSPPQALSMGVLLCCPPEGRLLNAMPLESTILRVCDVAPVRKWMNIRTSGAPARGRLSESCNMSGRRFGFCEKRRFNSFRESEEYTTLRHLYCFAEKYVNTMA